jgi:ABC-type branched-subunit amino acid transport system substrate-binding protein
MQTVRTGINRSGSGGRRRSTITIAYSTELTGEGGSQNGTSPAGFNARIALQNAQGGVHGHKLVPLVIDDQTNPSEIATAVQSAKSKGRSASSRRVR